MGRPKQPVELVMANGRKHLTKTEIEERKNTELKVNLTDIKPPEYLSGGLVDEFNDIALKLKTIGIMTELDSDLLARYLLSKQQYLYYTQKINKAMSKQSLEDCERWSILQDKAFKQCRVSASDLGLTISSRCRLVVPKTPEPKENKFNKYKKN